MSLRDESRHVTPAVAAEVMERCGGQCEHCFTKGVQLHHKKYRSRAPGDDELHTAKNIAALCPECHAKTHAGAPEMAKYRTHGWQEIGLTEADPE